ncbi:hypothetical protein AKJ16_DCAP16377 [Drosera capensis]
MKRNSDRGLGMVWRTVKAHRSEVLSKRRCSTLSYTFAISNFKAKKLDPPDFFVFDVVQSFKWGYHIVRNVMALFATKAPWESEIRGDNTFFNRGQHQEGLVQSRWVSFVVEDVKRNEGDFLPYNLLVGLEETDIEAVRSGGFSSGYLMQRFLNL